MKNIKIFGVLCITLSLLCSCQIYSVVKDATDHEEARVIMKDGTEYVGRVKMPKCNTENIRLTTADGKKVKSRIPTSKCWACGRKRIPICVTTLYATHTGRIKCSLPRRKKS